MLVELSDGLAVLVSSIAWLLIGLASGFAWSRVSLQRLSRDGWLTRPRRWEQDGRWYQRNLRIQRWKDRLPEKGDLFRDGFSKRHLTDRSDAHLERFRAETRRAELVHWCNLGAGPAFLLWCPPLLGGAMVAFGVVAHLPFIVVQRYNRLRLGLLLDRRARRGARR